MSALSALKVKTSVEVTVWKDGDDDFEYIFQSTILTIANDLFLIEEPDNIPNHIYGLLSPETTVGIVAYAKDKPVILYPKFYSHQKKAPKGFWLKIPSDALSDTIQRRGHVRVEMNLPLRLEYTNAINMEEELKATTLDVSGGGMKFTVRKGFAPNQDVTVHLNFYPNAKPGQEDVTLKLPAKVVFSVENQKSKGADDFYITAVQFQDLPDKDINKIMGECFKKELEKKRRDKELDL